MSAGKRCFRAKSKARCLRIPRWRIAAWGRADALLGQVVVAEIVWRGPERDALKVKSMLHEFAGKIIARHKLPATVRLVDAIASTRI